MQNAKPKVTSRKSASLHEFDGLTALLRGRSWGLIEPEEVSRYLREHPILDACLSF